MAVGTRGVGSSSVAEPEHASVRAKQRRRHRRSRRARVDAPDRRAPQRLRNTTHARNRHSLPGIIRDARSAPAQERPQVGCAFCFSMSRQVRHKLH